MYYAKLCEVSRLCLKQGGSPLSIDETRRNEARCIGQDKDDSATEIFVYTGIGEFFPYDVVRVRIDPSVPFIERR